MDPADESVIIILDRLTENYFHTPKGRTLV